MYGFNLGQIEGLDSSVQTVTLTIANATRSDTFTLTYVDNERWADLDNILFIDNGNVHLLVVGITDYNLGEVYNITLSNESIEPNFKAAVEEMIETLSTPQLPEELINALQSLYATHVSDIITANGQTCRLPTIVLDRTNAEDKEGFDEYYDSSIEIIHNPSHNTIPFNIPYRLVTGNNSGEMSIGPDYLSQSGYVFELNQRISFIDAGSTRTIQLIVYASLVKVLT